jgi:RimJ/RimL family protein N-acetyltransferase
VRKPDQITRVIYTFTGRPIQIRPIEADDWVALQRFHTTLSAETIFRRHFGLQMELSAERARYFTNVDGYNRVALVALDPDNPHEIIGVVRFDRDEPGGREAEYAAVITDGWHGQGLGIGMTCLLVNEAIDLGITTLYAIVQPDNWRMITLFRNLGLPERISYIDDVERIELAIGAGVAGVCRPAG